MEEEIEVEQGDCLPLMARCDVSKNGSNSKFINWDEMNNEREAGCITLVFFLNFNKPAFSQHFAIAILKLDGKKQNSSFENRMLALATQEMLSLLGLI